MRTDVDISGNEALWSTEGVPKDRGTAVDLKFRGRCLFGPWDGQQVNAEFPRISIASGCYDHAGEHWLWTPAGATS